MRRAPSRALRWARLPLAVALHLGKVAAEARSWHGIVSHAYPAGRVRFRTTFGAFAGAIGANAVLPARVGDALRLGIVRRRVTGSTVATIGATIVLETAIEVVFGLGVIAAVLVAGRSVGVVGSPTAVLHSHPIALGTIGVCAIVVGLAGWFMRRRLAGVTAAMAQGMSVVRRPRQLLRGVMTWKVLAWTLRFGAVYCFLRRLSPERRTLGGSPRRSGTEPRRPASACCPEAPARSRQLSRLALAGTVSAAAVVGFGVGMQVATTLADVAIGVVAVALISSWSDVGDALRPARRRSLLLGPFGDCGHVRRLVR